MVVFTLCFLAVWLIDSQFDGLAHACVVCLGCCRLVGWCYCCHCGRGQSRPWSCALVRYSPLKLMLFVTPPRCVCGSAHDIAKRYAHGSVPVAVRLVEVIVSIVGCWLFPSCCVPVCLA